MMPKDIMLDDDMDLLVEGNDLVLGESTHQHQKILIMVDKGEFKENITRGVGALRYAEMHNPESLMREIRQEFIADGMRVNSLSWNDGNLEIDANYDSKS
ncbi:hypothetical protein [Flavobacterium covae]|uniref:hypothetical protein n=2 Tax=Flavobacteriaceae TaxID=49546 RepID=UPI000B4D21BC|nr:hypothetical protein [Flavobacterium covae]